MENLLVLREYGVGFGDKHILNGVNLEIPEEGVFVVMGPAGTGKSTLLRTLTGVNNASPSLKVWGEAEFAGKPLGEGELPALVAQKTRLMMASIRENIVNDMPERNSLSVAQQKDVAKRLLRQAGLDGLIDKLDDPVVSLSTGRQRHLAIARTVASNPKMIFIDEPTMDVDAAEAEDILNFLRQEAERRAVVVILHNQLQAKKLGGRTALLAGGWIHDVQDTDVFFDSPESEAARDFVRSGSCSVPSPDTPDSHMEESMRESKVLSDGAIRRGRPVIPDRVKKIRSHSFGPRNFLWLRKGELAGSPRPGLFLDLDQDLTALQRVGVSVLVSLTTTPIDVSELERFSIKGVAYPIKDMGVPKVDTAIEFCQEMEKLLLQGEAIAMHCKAGMGRTGTMLVAQLIWEGGRALESLESARRIEPRWVQSEEQVKFLEEFETAVSRYKEKTAKKESEM